MSINQIIQTAYTGLAASQTALRTVSTNVANVNTPGYGRQEVHIESLVASGEGRGVKVSNVERVADRFLTAAAYGAQADAGQYEALEQYHDRLQGLIGTPDSESGVASRLNSVFASVADLLADPADAVRRQSVLSDVSRFLDDLSRLSNDVQSLRTDAHNQVGEAISVINQALSRVDVLNQRIVREKAIGGSTAGLEEQRAQALSSVAELIDIKASEQPNGSLLVTTSRGATLVDQEARQLALSTVSSVSAETSFSGIELLQISPTTGELVSSGTILDPELGSGKVRGLLDLRDRDLPNVAAAIGELASTFRDEVNAVHNASTSVPAPNALQGRNVGLLASDAARFTGRTTFAVVDAAGVVLATTTVDFDALGSGAPLSTVLAAVNGGLGGAASMSITDGVLSLTASNPANGLVIADDPAAPSARAGRGFSHTFGLNDLIVGDRPPHYDTGLLETDAHGFVAGGTINLVLQDGDNRILADYTMTVGGSSIADLLADLNSVSGLGSYASFALDARGALKMTPTTRVTDIAIAVKADSTVRSGAATSFSDLFGVGRGLQAQGALNVGINPEINADPFRLSLARFDPASSVGVQALGFGDQRGAVALRDLQTRALRFDAAGGVAGVSASLSQYTGFLLGEAAIAAQRATEGREDSQALRDDVIKRRDDFAGVNVDEELADLVIYQNSYNAAARVLSAARDIYDSLLNAV